MVPIYSTPGDWVAVYDNGHLYSSDGEWLGFVIGREVFDPAGQYVGFLSDDRRLLRKRTLGRKIPRMDPPPRPKHPRVPASFPLPPMMRELPHHIIDMFDEYPDRFKFVAETRPDLD